MLDFMQTLLALLVALSLLIAVHEWGHFLVARWCGVKVVRFSIGFGRPLVRRVGRRDGTEYVLATIPLGGKTPIWPPNWGSAARTRGK